MADKKLPSTEFRTTYAGLIEPCDVTVLGRVIGTYYPRGTEPEAGPLGFEVAYLKRELASRLTTKVSSTSPVPTFAPAVAVRSGFGHSNPAPKAGK